MSCSVSINCPGYSAWNVAGNQWVRPLVRSYIPEFWSRHSTGTVCVVYSRGRVCSLLVFILMPDERSAITGLFWHREHSTCALTVHHTFESLSLFQNTIEENVHLCLFGVCVCTTTASLPMPNQCANVWCGVLIALPSGISYSPILCFIFSTTITNTSTQMFLIAFSYCWSCNYLWLCYSVSCRFSLSLFIYFFLVFVHFSGNIYFYLVLLIIKILE